MIEGTVAKVHRGSEIVSKTNGAFARVIEGTGKVGELVEEIAGASREQAQGIGQISKAVSEMDRIVQKNAAGAEESAAVAGEMNAQAGRLRSVVGDLLAMVGKSTDEAREEEPDRARRQLRATVSAKVSTPRGDAGLGPRRIDGNFDRRPALPSPERIGAGRAKPSTGRG